MRAPTLLIVGGNDFEVLELNREALKQLRREKKLVLLPRATHLFDGRRRELGAHVVHALLAELVYSLRALAESLRIAESKTIPATRADSPLSKHVRPVINHSIANLS